VDAVRTLERLGLDPDELLTRLLRCGFGEAEIGYWEEYEVPALWWEGMSVAFHCGVWLTLRRVGNLVAYEGDCGPEERSSGGMDESDGCWAAIVASKTKRRGERPGQTHSTFTGTPRAGHSEIDGLRQK
jgi:hypothetical protein